MTNIIGAIVQARTSSQRYPNKVLHHVAGMPMLKYLLERLEHCDYLDAIVVATSNEDSDAPIEEFCRQNGVACFRGSLINVAERFFQLVNTYQFDAFVRITGDSPLLDQRLVSRALELFRHDEYDLVTNVLPRTYPKGQSVEVVSSKAFKETFHDITDADDLEHVTRYFHSNAQDFRIERFSLDENINHIRLCVDTRDDMDDFRKMISNMDKPHWEYSLDDILEIHSRVVQGNA